jgi:hypothetical protein
MDLRLCGASFKLNRGLRYAFNNFAHKSALDYRVGKYSTMFFCGCEEGGLRLKKSVLGRE